jgi:hypothetical protein
MSDLLYECRRVEPVGRGGLADGLEPRHRAAEARHAAPADDRARGGPAGEQLGDRRLERRRVHQGSLHGDPIVAR